MDLVLCPLDDVHRRYRSGGLVEMNGKLSELSGCNYFFLPENRYRMQTLVTINNNLFYTPRVRQMIQQAIIELLMSY